MPIFPMNDYNEYLKEIKGKQNTKLDCKILASDRD